jgi:threonine synthase
MDNLYYKSTRSDGSKILSSEAIVRGIAGDGGLYVPAYLPKIDRSFSDLQKMDYKQLAFYIMSKFFTDFSDFELQDCIDKSYDDKFDTPEIAPLVKKGSIFFLELYHGATLAFKDMALSLLPHLMKVSCKKIGISKEIVILTATSGDTGKAALESFANVKGAKIIVFYPDKGISEIQERQMTTQEGDNTYVVAIEGNFDDAQTGVKNIFNDRKFNEILASKNYMFSSANSINIGRLIPQIVYYIYSYIKLIEMGEIKAGQKINVVVPTGNFGNILASYYARGMGLPVNKFICASNENKVLYDFFTTGVYNRLRELKLTISPSMDILISSNLERLLYDLCGHDVEKLNDLIQSLNKNGSFIIAQGMRDRLKDFWGGFANENQTIEAIREVYNKFNYLIDTHTAVGYFVYKNYFETTKDSTETVIASTASPFKFPEGVLKAINGRYGKNDEFKLMEILSKKTGRKIPEQLEGIGKKEILYRTKCKKEEMKEVVSRILNL